MEKDIISFIILKIEAKVGNKKVNICKLLFHLRFFILFVIILLA